MKFSLMFFASSEEALAGDKYRLILQSARFADANGFSSLWVPERHFTEFGSLYPNPAVLQAAIAACTRRIRLQAGSVVAPIHHPLRIAEEWSMVDNLSQGRVGISFASGWNADDFVFAPEKYANRQDEMLASIRTIQSLWRGEPLEATSGNGKRTQVRIYPTPVQRELPIWLTAAGNPQTFIRAGEIGANLLTHVLDQEFDQLTEKIALYRKARPNGGGIVTVMLHTFVGSDASEVREQARAPFCNYIRRNIGLLNALAQSRGNQVDVKSMPARELDDFVQFLYERFAHSRGLIGTPETCLDLVQRLESIGVDEIACLLDFGPPAEQILDNLPHLLRLTEHYAAHARSARRGVAFDPEVVQSRCGQYMAGAVLNDQLREIGIDIGGEFQAIQEIWRRDGEALGKVRLPDSAGTTFKIHPAFLDACSRVLAAAVSHRHLYLPAGVGAIRIEQPCIEPEAWSHATLRASSNETLLEGDVRVYDSSGHLLIEIEALRLQRMNAAPTSGADLTDYLYQRVWKSLPLTGAATDAGSGDWLILADRQGVGARLAARLRELGHTCTLLFSDSVITVDRPLKGVVHLWNLDQPHIPLDLAKSLNARLWLITAGAMPVIEGQSIAPHQAPLWGFGRALSVEHPDRWGGLIDLDPDDLLNPQLADTILTAGREDMLALRHGARYVARIVRDARALGAVAASPLRFDQSATYLITGGLGGLGLRLASWLFEHGAGEVALLARRAPAQALQARLFTADLGNREQIAAVLDEIQRTLPPLKGIFHLAGTLDDALLMDQDIERFQRAGIGKVEGAWHLHTLTRDLELDHFVLFSSLASLVTTSGQGNYAAANNFLDALAHLRRAEGKPALSVNWGPWSDIGHATMDYGRRAHERLSLLGVHALAPDLALTALEHLMAAGVTQAAVARIDWPRLGRNDAAAAASPLLSDLYQTTVEAAATQQETPLVIRLKACAPRERLALVKSEVAALLARVLRLKDPDSIMPTQPIFEMGLDSILALELTSRISAEFGHTFRATLLFTHSTVNALASFVLDTVLPAPPPEELSTRADLTEDELARLLAEEIGAR
jgi:phthiocerol/phenolphthiocerol synthesis type-I polyketide synthase D